MTTIHKSLAHIARIVMAGKAEVQKKRSLESQARRVLAKDLNNPIGEDPHGDDTAKELMMKKPDNDADDMRIKHTKAQQKLKLIDND